MISKLKKKTNKRFDTNNCFALFVLVSFVSVESIFSKFKWVSESIWKTIFMKISSSYGSSTMHVTYAYTTFNNTFINHWSMALQHLSLCHCTHVSNPPQKNSYVYKLQNTLYNHLTMVLLFMWFHLVWYCNACTRCDKSK